MLELTQENLVQFFKDLPRREVPKGLSLNQLVTLKNEWFKSVLIALEVFGKNEIVNTDDYSADDDYYTPKPIKREVNINNFVFLEFNGLYNQALLNLYPTDEQWTHPAVLHLMRIKKNRHIIFGDAYRDLNLFLNNIYGRLAAGYKSYFTVSPRPRILNTKLESERIVIEAIKALGVEEHIVVIDCDTVLLTGINMETLVLNTKPASLTMYESIYYINRIAKKFSLYITRTDQPAIFKGGHRK